MTFDDAIRFVLDHEGGYTNDPLDPGGETRYGISRRAYPDLDIANLTRDEAVEIYKRDYWQACSCHALPESLRLPVFDSAVNQGVRTSSVLLQRALNRAGASIAEDGSIGPRTIRATVGTNPVDVRIWFLALRGQHYGNLSTFGRFGLGWMRRLIEVCHEP